MFPSMLADARRWQPVSGGVTVNFDARGAAGAAAGDGMTRSLNDLVRRALASAPFTTRALSEESGLSYDLLRSWRSGRRQATSASARRLATGLEARGRELLALAKEIRKEAGSSGEPRGGADLVAARRSP